jgi:hypothetical protein
MCATSPAGRNRYGVPAPPKDQNHLFRTGTIRPGGVRDIIRDLPFAFTSLSAVACQVTPILFSTPNRNNP